MRRMQAVYPGEFCFVPTSFLVPEQLEDLKTYMDGNIGQVLIGKPSQGKGGEGIFIFDKYQDIQHRLWGPKSSELLVQKYLTKPMVVDNKKFDLRLYAVIKGTKQLEVWVCQQGMARFCTEEYKSPSSDNFKDIYRHLTNTSLNKDNLI